MTDPGLFAEPDRTTVPASDGMWTVDLTGWRYMLVGDDGEYFVVQGHVRNAELGEVLTLLPAWYGMFPPDEVPVVRTWCRVVTACPTHAPKDATNECPLCHATPDEPWLDWSTPDGDPAANRGVEGYFPVTVIDLEV